MMKLAAALGKRPSGGDTTPPVAKAARVEGEPTMNDLKKKIMRVGRECSDGCAQLRELATQIRRDIAILGDEVRAIRDCLCDFKQTYESDMKKCEREAKQCQEDTKQAQEDLQCQMEEVIEGIKQIQDNVDDREEANDADDDFPERILKDQLEMRRDFCSLKEAVLNLGLALQQQHHQQQQQQQPETAKPAALVCTCPSSSPAANSV